MLEDVNGEPAKSSFFLLYEKVGVNLFFYKTKLQYQIGQSHRKIM